MSLQICPEFNLSWICPSVRVYHNRDILIFSTSGLCIVLDRFRPYKPYISWKLIIWWWQWPRQNIEKKTNTKCFKDLIYAIFSESRGLKDFDYGNFHQKLSTTSKMTNFHSFLCLVCKGLININQLTSWGWSQAFFFPITFIQPTRQVAFAGPDLLSVFFLPWKLETAIFFEWGPKGPNITWQAGKS